MSGSMQFYLAIAIFVLTYVAIMSEKDSAYDLRHVRRRCDALLRLCYAG